MTQSNNLSEFTKELRREIVNYAKHLRLIDSDRLSLEITKEEETIARVNAHTAFEQAIKSAISEKIIGKDDATKLASDNPSISNWLNSEIRDELREQQRKALWDGKDK